MSLSSTLRRLLVLGGLLSASVAGAIPPRPAPGDFLHDLAGLLTTQERTALRAQQQKVYEQVRVPIVVVIVGDMAQHLPGQPTIEAFARQWFNTWGIGSPGKNDGMLIIVSRGDRKARIELGADWGRRWDAYAQRVMNDRMVPRFKAGAYGDGLAAGVEALARAALAGAQSEPPALTGMEKFMATPLATFARENNPLLERAPQWMPWLLGLGALLVVLGLCIPEYRKPLLVAGLVVIGVVLLFWIVAAILAFLNRDRLFDSDDDGGGGGFGGGSSGGGGASGGW